MGKKCFIANRRNTKNIFVVNIVFRAENEVVEGTA